MTRPDPRSRTILALAAALALGLTACGAGDGTPATDGAVATPDGDPTEGDSATATDDGAATEDPQGDASGEFPVTVDADNGEVTLESRPERIVSLSPSTTEILFAIGAGDQVVAVDEFSTYPPNAPTTDLSGWDPNVEAIVAYEPDLVLVSFDPGELVASLTALDIPVMVQDAPADVEDGYDAVAGLGQATGQVDGAAGVVAGMRAAMDDALAAAPQDREVRVYHELDDTFFAASGNSFIGSVYARMGAVNIADAADTDGSGYPQLTEEAVVEADPELIVITDQATYTAEDVAARPGWSEVSAVRNGNIVTVDGDIASRWGPRLPQLVQVLAEAMDAVAAPAGR